jgi:TetR/AcrR family transcriptional regulator, mexJK operon transcriptional repressor
MPQQRVPATEPRRARRAADKLRAEILKAAAEVFFEAGYAGARIEAVIERVGGSKRAIYSHFGGKKELFEALVLEAASQALEALSPTEIAGLNLEGTLLAFGQRVLDAVMTPVTLALYRTIVAEGTRFPSLAKIFFEGGPGRAAARLAVVLGEFRAKGEIDIEDCGLAAEHFIGMLRGDLHLRVVLGLRPRPGYAEIEQSVRQATRIFLDGCRPRRADDTGSARSPRRAGASRVRSRKYVSAPEN